jgi:radical SAM family uncharacterized protein/radical SAM-linked protein
MNFSIWNEIRPHLKFVQKPGRYIGGEWNEIRKEEKDVTTRICLAFPDLYEIGMSHLGFKILYAILNRMEGVWAERAFAPWTDLETRLKKAGLPLVALESKRPLHQFDLVGFSLQFEMTYTGVLQMMDLGGIPVRSADRDERHPIVLGGGPAAVNPEPAWPFFDLILIGDGEEAFPELVAKHRELKREGVKREEMIRQLAQLPGWYAPALYSVARDPISQLLCLQASPGMPFPIKRRILMNLSDYPFPTDPVVPHLEIVHDRFSYEIMRGCNAGCRFCQAGYIYRPQRDRDPAEVQRGIKAGLQSTGYDEVTLASLNSGEYGSIDHLLEAGARNWDMETFAATALPSLRVPSVSTLMAKVLKRGRQKGFTLAPEGGSQRMRNVINKNVSDADIKRAAEIIFGEGWDLVKFYFIIGLPTETMEDIQGIIERCNDVLAVAKQKGRHRARINLSTSEFVPKPFTPFQWLPMEPRESVMDKIHHIKRRVNPRQIDYKYHDLDQSIVECAISRGDRSLAPVIERAWRNGCEFDGWHDRFSMKTWLKSFEDEGVDIAPFVYKEYPMDGGLPWDFINMDVRKSYFRQELAKAFQASNSAACGPDPCYGCGSFAKDCTSGNLKTDVKPVGIEVPERRDPRDGSGTERPSFRYRITFGKSGDLALFGHLDLIRTMVLIMGRSRLPIKYSQGFHPIPEMNFGPALPLGVSGSHELMDLYLNEPVEAEKVLAALQQVTLPQLPIHAVQAIDRKAVKIQEATAFSEYHIEIADAQWREVIRPALPAFLAMTECQAEIKRGEEKKLKDIRPMVVSAEWVEGDAQIGTPCAGRRTPFIHAILKSGNDGGLKAEDFVSALAKITGSGDQPAAAPLNERIIATRIRLLTPELKEIPAPPPVATVPLTAGADSASV